MRECEDSRNDITDGGLTFRYVTPSNDADDVLAGAIAASPSKFLGFVRQYITMTRLEGVTKIDVKYGRGEL